MKALDLEYQIVFIEGNKSVVVDKDLSPKLFTRLKNIIYLVDDANFLYKDVQLSIGLVNYRSTRPIKNTWFVEELLSLDGFNNYDDEVYQEIAKQVFFGMLEKAN